jgi:hypothetical protein
MNVSTGGENNTKYGAGLTPPRYVSGTNADKIPSTRARSPEAETEEVADEE